MNGKNIILAMLLVCSGIVIHATTQRAFLPGEKIIYAVYFNWKFIWLKSGEVTFHFSEKETGGIPRWNFSATGHTFKPYDLLYKIRDTMTTETVPGTLAPVLFRQQFHHAGNSSFYQYRLPAGGNQIFSEVKRFGKPFFRDTLTMVPGLKDMLATAYSFRLLDFQNLKPGQKEPFTMLVDNEIHRIHYTYLGKETILNRKKMPFVCHKFSVTLLEGDFFPAGEHLTVWFDDRQNHFPIQVEAKIWIGSVKAIIETAEVYGESVSFEL